MVDFLLFTRCVAILNSASIFSIETEVRNGIKS